MPRHVAIIMDGNGRWASARGLPRGEGHRRGVEALRKTVRAAGEMGIRFLTIFSFSAENWSRPPSEIRDLMGLSELVERIDNAIKSVGDFYAARVYRGAMRRLRIEAWKESIERKQTLIGEAYEMLKGEAEVRRGLILEVTVIVLIVIEVIQAFMGGH